MTPSYPYVYRYRVSCRDPSCEQTWPDSKTKVVFTLSTESPENPPNDPNYDYHYVDGYPVNTILGAALRINYELFFFQYLDKGNIWG